MAGWVFGYGSLVHPDAHRGREVRPARLRGWRREWCQTSLRAVPYLSVRKAPGETVLGLMTAVAPGDWAALDRREHAYDRHPVDPEHDTATALPAAQVYSVADEHRVAGPPGPILMSYLDVVVQGYRMAYGTAGVASFFATTDGWRRPILDDRAAPRYPRAVRLPRADQRLVDRHLAALSVTVEELEDPEL